MRPGNNTFKDEYTASFTTCFCTFTFPTLLLFLQEIWSFWPLGGLSKVHEKLSSHSGLGPVETTCHPIIKDISSAVYSFLHYRIHYDVIIRNPQFLYTFGQNHNCQNHSFYIQCSLHSTRLSSCMYILKLKKVKIVYN